jgi:hypothetical protein
MGSQFPIIKLSSTTTIMESDEPCPLQLPITPITIILMKATYSQRRALTEYRKLAIHGNIAGIIRSQSFARMTTIQNAEKQPRLPLEEITSRLSNKQNPSGTNRQWQRP